MHRKDWTVDTMLLQLVDFHMRPLYEIVVDMKLMVEAKMHMLPGDDDAAYGDVGRDDGYADG
jgi:hypothetical protein